MNSTSLDKSEKGSSEKTLPPLSFVDCFRFPIETPDGRHDIWVGGLLLFTLIIGWIINLGHRLDVVYRLYHDQPPYYRGFSPWGRTFLRGLKAFGAISIYLSPAAVFYALAHGLNQPVLGVLAGVCFIGGIFTLPGGMTYNAAFNDLSYLYRPDKSFFRALHGGRYYLKAWLIGLAAICLSFLGLLIFGIGFFWTSVWAWHVVGVAFSRALVLRLNQPDT